MTWNRMCEDRPTTVEMDEDVRKVAEFQISALGVCPGFGQAVFVALVQVDVVQPSRELSLFRRQWVVVNEAMPV